ncbi:MAG: M23 family metallopeptidase [Firmicutes bacterium]|nr:M23 family metallopeptidase [Bacillota bacterium]
MDKNKFGNIIRKRRNMLSALLCLVALGTASAVTSYRGVKQDGGITAEVPEVTSVPYEKGENVMPVISSKNAETKVTREDVIEVVEEYSYDDESKTVASVSDEFILEWPVTGEIVMDYSTDSLIYDVTLEQYRTNDSVSISAEEGENVAASAKGTVKKVAHSREDGWYVVIDHENGWETTYGQLRDDLAVKEGDRVDSGDTLGFVADPSVYGAMLGEHVEFKVTLNDYAVDPKTAVGENTGE